MVIGLGKSFSIFGQLRGKVDFYSHLLNPKGGGSRGRCCPNARDEERGPDCCLREEDAENSVVVERAAAGDSRAPKEGRAAVAGDEIAFKIKVK